MVWEMMTIGKGYMLFERFFDSILYTTIGFKIENGF